MVLRIATGGGSARAADVIWRAVQITAQYTPGGVCRGSFAASGGSYFASIFLAGMVVTIVPLAAGTIAALYVLKMSPLMALGGLAGAQTCTPGLNALREASDSNIGSLAYTVPYAINNILLTVWGPVIVAIVHAMRTP